MINLVTDKAGFINKTFVSLLPPPQMMIKKQPTHSTESIIKHQTQRQSLVASANHYLETQTIPKQPQPLFNKPMIYTPAETHAGRH